MISIIFMFYQVMTKLKTYFQNISLSGQHVKIINKDVF